MSGMVGLSIESNLDDVEKEVSALGLCMPDLDRKILSRVSLKGRAKLRKAYKASGIHTARGDLYKAIFASAKSGEVAYFGVASKQHYKFIPINYGEELRPTRNDFLLFQGSNGDWHRVRSVHIKAHDFFAVALNYVNSPEFQEDIDRVVDREVSRMFKI